MGGKKPKLKPKKPTEKLPWDEKSKEIHFTVKRMKTITVLSKEEIAGNEWSE